MGRLKKYIPSELANTIIQLYEHDLMFMHQIAEKLQVSYGLVRSVLILNNIETSTHRRAIKLHKVNEHYFKELTPNSAYILGFLMADGYVRIDKHNSHILGINLHVKDIEILEFIKKELSPNKNIIYGKNNKGEKGQKVSLRVCSEEIFHDLSYYGIVPNKTGKEQLKNIPIEFGSHFIRGLFDGDGHIRFKKKKLGDTTDINLVSICSANKSFLESLRDNFSLSVGTIDKSKTKSGYVYNWRIQKIQDLYRLYQYLYESDTSFRLKRKFDKFKMMIDYYRESKYDLYQ